MTLAAPSVFVSIFAELDAFRAFYLCAMCLVAKADNVSTFVYQADGVILTVAEFLNSTDIEAATLTLAQFLTQLLAILHDGYFAQA